MVLGLRRAVWMRYRSSIWLIVSLLSLFLVLSLPSMTERTLISEEEFLCPTLGEAPPVGHPELAHSGGDASCEPRFHIGFLKTYRCASSSVQNILFRAAARHELFLIVPESGDYISKEPFHRQTVCRTSSFRLGYHMTMLYTRWNHNQVRRVMPNDTVYISIVRDPVAQFLSMFHHLEMNKFVSIDQFADELTEDRLEGVFGRNQQLWDMGLPVEDMNDENLVWKYVAKLNTQLHLVLVAERMDESLILLRELLCWPTEYLVSLRLNMLLSSNTLPPKESSRQKLAHWQNADYILYKHFAGVLERKIEKFGKRKMEDAVQELQRATMKWVEWCKITRNGPWELKHDMKWSQNVYGYETRNKTRPCLYLVLNEHFWVNFFRTGQNAVWSGNFSLSVVKQYRAKQREQYLRSMNKSKQA